MVSLRFPAPSKHAANINVTNPAPHPTLINHLLHLVDTPEGEVEEEDDDDDGIDHDVHLATQPLELPPLLSQVYDIESLDTDIPDTSCDRGDPDYHTLDHNDERPSRT